jgi:sodium-dependent dicarboxylate transporter 2/3/5
MRRFMNSATSTALPAQKTRSKATVFLGSFLIASALTWFLTEEAFTTQQVIVLFLTLLSVGLWVTEATPAFAVALLIIAVLVLTLGYEGFMAPTAEVKVYTDTLSNSVIWLMLGGFSLAAAMTKTGLSTDLINFSIRICGTQPKWLLFGMMLVTMVASMIMSNSTTTAMVIAALLPLVNQVGKTSSVSKALILGIPIAASTGGMATLIGSPTNLLAAAAAETVGKPIDFVKWLILGMPIALLFTFLSWWILTKLLIKDAPPLAAINSKTNSEENGTNKTQRMIVVIILIASVLLWLTSPVHGFRATAVAAVPLVFLPLTGILKGADIRGLGWDTLILIAGGLALGEGLMRSGLLTIYAERIATLGLSPTVLLFSMAYLTMILSNAMSNTAACALLLPLARIALPNHVMEASVIIGLAASTSMFLPVSTPPNAIAYATGLITQKDFMYGGIPVGLLGPGLIVLWVLAMA